MGFNFESSRNNEVNEIADDQISSEQLSETEETAENFDDCSLYEVKDNSGNEVNSETLEEAEDDFEDCEAKMDELEEENPELSEEDNNFDDCGNETEGQYVAEVTYTTDGEVSDEEIDAELQEAYDECDDPEDMQQLKENANENEHIEVVSAEVIERPEASNENTKEEYEEAKQEYEEAQEKLEEQQEAAEEYEEKLSENIEKEEATVENTNNISFEENIETDESIQEDDKSIKDPEEIGDEENEASEENVEKDAGNIEDSNVETENLIDDNTSETLEETELNNEEVEETIEEKAEEAQEAFEEQTEEKEEVLEDAEEVASEEIDESVEDNVNSEEDLSEDEIKENVEEDTSEALAETELSDEEAEEIIGEKTGETVEDEKDIKEIEEETEEIADNLEENEEQSAGVKEEKDLSDRIDSALDKKDSSYSELNDLAKENADVIESLEKERNNVEAEMSDKFNEVLSKERGTDEYKETLQEYNTLKDRKAELDEKYLTLSKQQDALERKSAELREAQIAKGNEAIAESAETLAESKALEARFDELYYDKKPNSKALKQLTEDNTVLIGELSSEKDAIKSAMDAKMDEISKYITSNNMGKYESSKDLHYQKLNSEYLAMRSSYDKVSYSIVKLDENSRLMAEIMPGNRRFGAYQVDDNGFVKGEKYNQYIDVWNNYSDENNKVETFDNAEVVVISPSSVEGIWVSDYDVSNPDKFWSHHEPEGTEQSFREIASRIPAVKNELCSGKSLSEIMEDPELGECANIYFNPSKIPEVIKCGDYYEFQGNGRHRILAARAEGHDIPVKVVGERENIKSDFSDKHEKLKDFFAGIFSSNEDSNVTEFNSEIDTTTQISDVSESVVDNKEQYVADRISEMDNSDLSESDKKFMFDVARKHITEQYGEYGDLSKCGDLSESIQILSTEECKKAYEKDGSVYANTIVGFYNRQTKETYIDAERNETPVDVMATVEHEMLHKASNGGLYAPITDESGNKIYSPLLCMGLNEGITEMLAIEDMKDMGFEYTSYSYVNEVDAARMLSDAMGTDKIKQAYFGNNLELLRQEFETAFATRDELSKLKPGETYNNGKFTELLKAINNYGKSKPGTWDYKLMQNRVKDLINRYVIAKNKGGIR